MSFIQNIALNLFRALANAYGMSVTLFLFLNWLIGERWAVLAFFETFVVWVWLFALIVLPLALLTRSWWSALMVMPSIIALGVQYGGQFLPKSIPSETPNLTVLTYNLYADGRSPQASLAIIRDSGADIVALQEYSLLADSVLPENLRELYPYQATHPTRIATQGQAVYSRYPIIEDSVWQYDWLPVGKLMHQRVLLDIDGRLVALYNSHPTHPGMQGSFFNPVWRSREIDDLLTRTQQETVPTLWLGDFNMPDQSDDYARITAHFGDSYRAVGWGFGFTWRWALQVPFVRLDYVFHSADFTPLWARVWTQNGGSDHYPVIVAFKF
jgi:vancomycin resistance protein VanJ